MISLSSKKVLMFYPYGATKHYGESIKSELIRRGAIVYGYDERPSQKTLTKIVIRLFRKKVPQIFDKYIKKIIKKHSGEEFNYILICRGEAFTPLTIGHLKKSFPGAKVILYLWDILRTTKVGYNIPCCDRAMSFDPDDVDANEGLLFRPTFFVPEYRTVIDNSQPDKDIVFIGTLHSDRHKLISVLDDSFTKQGFKFYSYLYVPSLLVYIKDFILKFPYIDIKKVHFTPISLRGTVEVLDDAKAILDINYTGQRSLSTRAFESMSARRKYITTNEEVKTYDFYNPNNILVIDINNPSIPTEFISTPFVPVSEDILYKYSVAGLVDDLFEV